MDNKDFVFFVLKRSPNGRMRSHYGFSSYDLVNGDIAEYHEGKISRSTGAPEPAKFSFSRRHKVMNVHKKAFGKDRYGNTISKVDFMRGHPECEGSPNNTGQQTWFKEMDSDKDVDTALEANNTRRTAENKAAALEGEELRSAAALYNEVSESSKKQKFAVLQWAFHDPEGFMKATSTNEYKIKGFIKRCLSHGILEKEGTIIRWGSVTIGIDEDDAVRKILLDETVAKSLAKLLKGKEGTTDEVPTKDPVDLETAVKEEIAKSKE